ncbi:hypothetical protein DL89DRAFT_30979 [Linderina pennispora]|uniref:HSF-type DNA-binding domain-containing protein n=1 Tax=Linderina pennispora TaxID=61395 RepID=A0A1Y1W511_9FUNG|nr:uncharacterized protein DL89DRAFT_30979 [Linderina pennispora]ORX68294.1 hypothetical protein DL89DRAFT_30979 [Linderina pennispora]
MAASQVDSLQKNFNDYKFKRITDQRRLRHINEKRTVIFEHEFFKPGRPDLLERIVRKSAELKAKRMRLAERESQQQSQIASNYGHHQSLPPPLPHRNRVRSEDSKSVSRKSRAVSGRAAGGRTMRSVTGERPAPYSRSVPVDYGLSMPAQAPAQHPHHLPAQQMMPTGLAHIAMHTSAGSSSDLSTHFGAHEFSFGSRSDFSAGHHSAPAIGSETMHHTAFYVGHGTPAFSFPGHIGYAAPVQLSNTQSSAGGSPLQQLDSQANGFGY